MAADRRSHPLADHGLRLCDARQFFVAVLVADTRANLFRFEVEHLGERIDFALMVEDDEAALVALGEKEAAIFERAA